MAICARQARVGRHDRTRSEAAGTERGLRPPPCTRRAPAFLRWNRLPGGRLAGAGAAIGADCLAFSGQRTYPSLQSPTSHAESNRRPNHGRTRNRPHRSPRTAGLKEKPMYSSFCPHCSFKLGRYFYADACPRCRQELNRATRSPTAVPKQQPGRTRAWPARGFLALMRFVES